MTDDKPQVHIDSAKKRPGLPEYDWTMPCPHCGGVQEHGFGLGGGGFGPYTYCPACERITSKTEIEE